MGKIVFVVPNMTGGGTERVVALFANELVRRGYETAIMLFAGDEVVYPLDERIELVVVGEKSDGNLTKRIKRIVNMRKYYKQNKDSYIFGFSVMGTVFSVIAAAGIPHRLLVSERNDPRKMHHQKLRDWAYRKAEKLIFQTEDVMDCFSEDIKRKSVVIPNPVPDEIPETYAGIRKKRIVSVARLEPQKNHKLLIDAFAEFVKDFPDYELHIFGIGELETKLRKQTKELDIEAKVNFRGFSKQVKEEIIDSAMFVLSSDYEGISNSMIEALAMGVPVISTDCPVGGSRAYMEDGVSGILVPVGDKQALTDAMKRLAAEPEFAKKISENGTQIREKYGLKKITDMLLEEAKI